MKCWNCGSLCEVLSLGKLSFRAVCDKCYTDLHCCKNCKYYKVGSPNDCAVIGTEPIYDRSINNFCEEFAVTTKTPQSKTSDSVKRFEDLFK